LSDTNVYEPQIRARLGNHNTTILVLTVLTWQACALMIRHMAQRTRIATDLAHVQLLVFPAQVLLLYSRYRS